MIGKVLFGKIVKIFISLNEAVLNKMNKIFVVDFEIKSFLQLCEEEVLYELFMNAGPLEKVHQPTDTIIFSVKRRCYMNYS